MDKNFRRRLVAGLFAPVLGLSVGAALAQSSSTGSTAGSGSAATQGSGGSASQSGSQGSGAMGSGSSRSGMSGSTSGSAPAGGSWNAQTFDRLDRNRDGMLTKEEAKTDPTVSAAWDRLDAGNSGRVSRSDFTRFGSTQGSGMSGGSRSGSSTGSTAK